jgi:asparagine synthase (glutamine-hydrolysing)
MCGISGILTRDADGSEAARVGAMQQALRHRGPDDHGTWQAPSGHATFGNTRLAILDLSRAGHQPMTSADGRLTITFNGAIYNFKELRQMLAQRGIQLRTETDTEVILGAYEAFGEGCVDHLRGMFAFAIWNDRDRSCFLARDRFGIKPFYYQAEGGRLMFASEVRALLATGEVPSELDGDAMFAYFRAGSVQEPRTLLKSVRCLEAGHVATWRNGRLQIRRYWSVSFATAETPAQPVEATHNALIDSVRHHFVSDVPVGILLSGGIDSTSLVALAREAGVGDLRTFTLSIPGFEADESDRARRTAEHFGTRHEEYRVGAMVGRDLFTGFLQAMDQPSIDGLNTFAVAGFTSSHGMKVMLSGLGADEMFGGYPSFANVPRLARWNRTLAAAQPVRTTVANVLRASSDPRHRRVADFLTQRPTLAAAYATYRGIFTRAESRILAERYTGAPCAADDEEPPDDARDATAQDAVSRLELSRYVRNQLLRDGDVMSMARGVELRTPFLDGGLFDAVARIPAAERLAPGKRLLLDAVPNLPDGVASSPKRCFQFPFDDWLDQEWQQLFASIERTCPVPAGKWYRKWCVFVLEHWLRTMTNGVRAWT